MILRAALPLMVFAMAACSTTAAPPPSDPPMAGKYRAEAANGLVGQLATPDMVERARSQSGSKQVRVIRPGMMVTMDYLPDRLNIDVDATGRITGLWCG